MAQTLVFVGYTCQQNRLWSFMYMLIKEFGESNCMYLIRYLHFQSFAIDKSIQSNDSHERADLIFSKIRVCTLKTLE